MKISDENYNKIKLAMLKYCKDKNISLNDLHIGNFFDLHVLFTILSKNNYYLKNGNENSKIDIIKDIKIKKEHYKLSDNWFNEEGFFIINNYILYPDNCNDSHLETVFKKLQK